MSEVNPWRVLVKAALAFAALNAAFAALNPPIGRLSIYNWLVKGRERLPSGTGLRAHNVSPDNLDAAIAAHQIASAARKAGEYRVVVLGDSAVWGVPVVASDSLTAKLNRRKLSACGKSLRFYNLASPAPSVLKDFVILNRALAYKPDLVVWMVTLNSMSLRTPPPFWGAALHDSVSELLARYDLDRYRALMGEAPTFLERTLVGQHASLERILTLQLDGLVWQATGIDSFPHGILKASNNVRADLGYSVPSFIPGEAASEFVPPRMSEAQLQFDVLRAARKMVGNLPVLLVNEPIFIATGINSDIRYNNLYPRWAFDQFRQDAGVQARALGWSYADLYDAVPREDFRGTLHMGAAGEAQLAKTLAPYVVQAVCP